MTPLVPPKTQKGQPWGFDAYEISHIWTEMHSHVKQLHNSILSDGVSGHMGAVKSIARKTLPKQKYHQDLSRSNRTNYLK